MPWLEAGLREIAGISTLVGFGANHSAAYMPLLQSSAMRLCGEGKANSIKGGFVSQQKFFMGATVASLS